MSVLWSSLEVFVDNVCRAEYTYSGESARLSCVGHTDQSQRFLGAHVLLTLLSAFAPFPKLVALELAWLYSLLPRVLERETCSSARGGAQIQAEAGNRTLPW